jgi:Uncharacterized protein conserved in bacteria
MNPKVDVYLAAGCGRCPLGNTPQCKVHNWREELELLREIVLECGLTEELKWGVPCYTFRESNVLLISAFKEYCTLSFFKGALLKDAHKILSKTSENMQAGRLIKFTNVQDVIRMKPILKAYIEEAVEVEKAGLKVNFEKNPEPVPLEFQNKLDENPDLKKAFAALTPGRRRGYIIYFSQPKQSKTRASRIEKCIPRILSGKGLNDK